MRLLTKFKPFLLRKNRLNETTNKIQTFSAKYEAFHPFKFSSFLGNPSSKNFDSPVLSMAFWINGNRMSMGTWGEFNKHFWQFQCWLYIDSSWFIPVKSTLDYFPNNKTSEHWRPKVVFIAFITFDDRGVLRWFDVNTMKVLSYLPINMDI